MNNAQIYLPFSNGFAIIFRLGTVCRIPCRPYNAIVTLDFIQASDGVFFFPSFSYGDGRNLKEDEMISMGMVVVSLVRASPGLIFVISGLSKFTNLHSVEEILLFCSLCLM